MQQRKLTSVTTIEFVSDRVSYIMLRGRWCGDTIVVNVHALSEGKRNY